MSTLTGYNFVWLLMMGTLDDGDSNLYQGFKTRDAADAAFLAFKLSTVC